ncbi:response regulator transcription factor [Saccharococcus caldoxylosilyticus]|uniref:response regulator transcription factor n=1 Tax=Saccharococcus caldoxylosilyticus TaxID=81408 RepID=UPI001FCBF515|nr:response regulator transcription factor [Parageobacillus caldoxylosilyticus]BDG37109.1 hypothetical protein PcaKH15_30150 [Parageobacillus caldoxylosilyticus]BDG40900.1 hypothetical protein PcaKH16_30390 [Parageobacillus caldoxylosilyticus]BDG44650.1 hypothetical protein PcaKH35_29950 [Parageobacillus caldoxylosilyticus]
MCLMLKEKMNNILQNGIDMIQDHHELILAKWKEKLSELQKKQNIAAQPLETAIGFFSERLFTKRGDIEELLQDIEEGWKHNSSLFPSNKMTFIFTLLENAAHEAIQSNIGDSFQEHQAVQYLFSKIHEVIFKECNDEKHSIDHFLEQLASSRQLPIHWIAELTKSEEGFYVKKMYSQTNFLPSTIDRQLKADTLFALSESLLEFMPKTGEKMRVFPIPWQEKILLFCTNETEHQALPFIMHSLQMFNTGEKALEKTKQEQLWKDAVILFDQWIMRAKTLHQAFEYISSGFVNYLPFERCALFAYSSANESGFGLYGYQLNNEEIKNIHENINGLPLIKNYMQRLQLLGGHITNLPPIYVSEAAEGLPIKYVKQFQLESIVIAPIYVPSESKLIGAAILDQGPGKPFNISSDIFTAVMKFGQSAGEILAKFGGDRPEFPQAAATPHLSPREIEVLKLVAEGASTYEAAKRLHLSEYTVRDYVSTILQKMNAKNRTEAIVKAIRDGII